MCQLCSSSSLALALQLSSSSSLALALQLQLSSSSSNSQDLALQLQCSRSSNRKGPFYYKCIFHTIIIRCVLLIYFQYISFDFMSTLGNLTIIIIFDIAQRLDRRVVFRRITEYIVIMLFLIKALGILIMKSRLLLIFPA